MRSIFEKDKSNEKKSLKAFISQFNKWNNKSSKGIIKTEVLLMIIKRALIFIGILVLFSGCSLIENINTINIDNNNIGTQYIENCSVEETDKTDVCRPENWSYNHWGNNKAKFTYLDEGRFGNHSLKIEVSDYIDGDAKWVFKPVRLSSGEYIFSNYYRSDVDTKVIVSVTIDDGSIEYIDLPIALASESWAKYEECFEISEHGDAATVYHLLSQDGYLITDDYQIKPYDYEGFNQGMVTITFDDGWEQNTQTALPIMQKYGFKSNQFYATDYIENSWVSNPKELIQKFIDDGHEIGSHSITHPYLTTLSKEEVNYELKESKSFLENYLNINIEYFATPYGDYNGSVKENIMQHYNVHRTAIDFGFNSKDNFDLSRLKSMSVLATTTASDIEKWVKKAKEENLWLILLYHRVADDPNIYDTTPEMFEKHMQVIKEADLKVVTFSEAISEIEGE